MKGQVTLYAILGIVVVASIVTIYMFKDTLFKSAWEREIEKSLAIPEQAKKVKFFMESCIDQVLGEGVGILAAQGGYIIPPADPLPPTPLNPMSNVLDLFNKGNAPVAYWFYETANGVKKSQVPTMQMMQKELESYVASHLGECIDGFDFFLKQGYEITSGRMAAQVRIADEMTTVTMFYPVSIYHSGFSFTFEKFYGSAATNLGKMYQQAAKIMQAENQGNFIENYALDIMRMYENIPYSGIDFECTPKTWERTQVITSLKHALAANIPLIKIEGTSYGLTDKDNQYFVVPTGQAAKDVTVQFQYNPQWPLLIDILGESGPILQGKPYLEGGIPARFLRQFFCLNEYHFVYDLKFPVLVTLADAQGNIFQFATMAVIDNNQPRANKAEQIPVIEAVPEICEKKPGRVQVAVAGRQYTGALIPLPGAAVSLKCLATTCPLGITQIDGRLTADVPQCINGMVIAEKPGFYRAESFVSIVEDTAMTLILDPIYTFQVNVQVQDNNNIRPLQPTEQAIFSFVEANTGYTTHVAAPGSSTVALLPGTYEINSQLVVSSDPPFKMEGRTIEVCIDVPQEGILGVVGLKDKKCSSHTIEPASLPQVVSGGSSITWSPSEVALASARQVTLYIVRSSSPQTMQDIINTEEKLKQNAQQTRQPLLA